MDIETLNKIAASPYLPTRKLTDLEKDKIYLITQMRKVNVQSENAFVLELNKEFDVFIPHRVTRRLVRDDEMCNGIEEAIKLSKLYLMYVPETRGLKFVQL